MCCCYLYYFAEEYESCTWPWRTIISFTLTSLLKLSHIFIVIIIIIAKFWPVKNSFVQEALIPRYFNVNKRKNPSYFCLVFYFQHSYNINVNMFIRSWISFYASLLFSFLSHNYVWKKLKISPENKSFYTVFFSLCQCVKKLLYFISFCVLWHSRSKFFRLRTLLIRKR